MKTQASTEKSEMVVKQSLPSAPEINTEIKPGTDTTAVTAAKNAITPPKPVPVPPHILQAKVALLGTTFNTIYKERMNDIPIVNDDIKVHVVGFQQWQNSYLCIMITPWFMNLMLLPGETENWDDKHETTSESHTFPSGNYQFHVGFEPDIGKYQMCSLFSPMFDFADNAAAVETAEVAVKELMNIENIEQNDIDSAQIQAIWDGTEEHPDKIAAREAAAKIKADAPPRKPLKERINEPVSRRQLLRGALMLEGEEKTVATKTAKAVTTNTKITNKSQHD